MSKHSVSDKSVFSECERLSARDSSIGSTHMVVTQAACCKGGPVDRTRESGSSI